MNIYTVMNKILKNKKKQDNELKFFSIELKTIKTHFLKQKWFLMVRFFRAAFFIFIFLKVSSRKFENVLSASLCLLY